MSEISSTECREDAAKQSNVVERENGYALCSKQCCKGRTEANGPQHTPVELATVIRIERTKKQHRKQNSQLDRTAQ